MTVGESLVITLPDEESINLSRRGHLDVFHLGNKQWRLTALRGGVVMISPTESSTENFRVLINIKKNQRERNTKPQKQRSNFINTVPLVLELSIELISKKDMFVFGPKPQAKLPIQIESLQTNEENHILAEPQTDIYPHKEVIMQSGGEFQVQYNTTDKDQTREGWKTYGLTVKALLSKVGKIKGHLEYDIKMSSTAMENSKLTTHRLKSKSLLSIGKENLAGILDMSSENDGFSTLAYMKHIPIIGPLFRLTQKQSAYSRILIWMTLKKKGNADATLKSRTQAQAP